MLSIGCSAAGTKVKCPICEGFTGACTLTALVKTCQVPCPPQTAPERTPVWADRTCRRIHRPISLEAGTLVTLPGWRLHRLPLQGTNPEPCLFWALQQLPVSSSCVPFCFLLCSSFLLLCRDSPVSGPALHFPWPSWLLKPSQRMLGDPPSLQQS